MMAEEDIWESLFHLCAFRAYLEIWASTKLFPPDSEATRRRAYQLYEEALAEKNGRPRRRNPQPKEEFSL